MLSAVLAVLTGLAAGVHLPVQNGRDSNMTRPYHDSIAPDAAAAAAGVVETIPIAELMNFMRPATPVTDDTLAKPANALQPTNILNGGFKLGSTSQIRYEGNLS